MRTPSPAVPDLTPRPPLTLEELTDIALARETMSPRELYVALRGRVSRKTFWLHGVLALSLLWLLLKGLAAIAGLDPELSGSAVNLLLLWPVIAISAKRWHDCDFKGWWALVTLTGIGLVITLIPNGFMRGTPGPNRFGPDPLAAG
jgi:uncharacterized membrane protein YhaH (DUF805 family)